MQQTELRHIHSKRKLLIPFKVNSNELIISSYNDNSTAIYVLSQFESENSFEQLQIKRKTHLMRLKLV